MHQLAAVGRLSVAGERAGGSATPAPKHLLLTTALTSCPCAATAAVDILCVGPKPVRQRYSGVIRVQDVRATEIDKVRGNELRFCCDGK